MSDGYEGIDFKMKIYDYYMSTLTSEAILLQEAFLQAYTDRGVKEFPDKVIIDALLGISTPMLTKQAFPKIPTSINLLPKIKLSYGGSLIEIDIPEYLFFDTKDTDLPDDYCQMRVFHIYVPGTIVKEEEETE